MRVEEVGLAIATQAARRHMPRAGPTGGALLGDEGLLQAARPLGVLAGLGLAGHQRRQRERERERGPHCRGLARRADPPKHGSSVDVGPWVGALVRRTRGRGAVAAVVCCCRTS